MSVHLELEIKSGNAALVEDPPYEIQRILKQAADLVEEGDDVDAYCLRDSNGNTVGHVQWEIKEEDDD